VKSKACYDRLAFLLPYYEGHPEIRPVLLLRSRFERLKLLSRVYPFNSSLFTIAVGNLESNRRRRPDDRGYIPLDRRWGGPLGPEETPRDAEIDTVLVRHFEWFVSMAEGSGVRLFVVVSPSYYEREEESTTIRAARETCERRGVPFWNMKAEPYFLERPDLFQDPYHLNHDGAEEFSRRVAERMRGALP
jgi:hypothetical protein